MAPGISIVVPVYNAEAYLKRCVESILAQTFTDWELLLIDDGSRDQSGAICDELALLHDSIRVFHQPNGGVASARETGMCNARGEYSIHVDPDDWIEPDTLMALYSQAKADDADMVVYDFALEYPGRTEILNQSAEDSDSFLKALFSQQRHGSLCNKLIRTELYRRHDLHFPEEMICWEDLYICCRILMHPCRVSHVPRAMYHYDFFSNPNSMVRIPTEKTLSAMRIFCDYFDNVLGPEKDLLRETKALVLLTAYRSGLRDADSIRTMYPDINEWYVARYGRAYSLPLYHAVARILSGKSMSGARRIQKFEEFGLRVISKIKRIIAHD